MLFRGIVS